MKEVYPRSETLKHLLSQRKGIALSYLRMGNNVIISRS